MYMVSWGGGMLVWCVQVLWWCMHAMLVLYVYLFLSFVLRRPILAAFICRLCYAFGCRVFFLHSLDLLGLLLSEPEAPIADIYWV